MNGKLAMLILAFNALMTAAASAERMRWEIADGGNGHWYEALTRPRIRPGVLPITWAAAEQDAEARGGYLASITSEAENNFVFSLIDSPIYWLFDGAAYLGPWLGGVQAPDTPVPAANWSWATGEPFEYTNWHAGEPNDNLGRHEDRLMFLALPSVTGQRSPYWNDEMGTSMNVVSYVVEYVPEPTSFIMCAIAVSLLGAVVNRRRH